ncbi:MAG TPA: ATP-binding cassette domain-containing protein [Candidatus Dormibacteraeota bacterium]|nr:ATP-binding cassette domain-containing protein [Candidatus Dormibacteraeota bacterium]
MIRARQLRKVFQASVPHRGRLAGLRNFLAPDSREIIAVEDVDFTLTPGESVGYLGPNGAGQSTTIKMLTGILVPTSGTVEIGGLSPHRDRLRNSRQIGVVFGQRSQLIFDLPVSDSYELLRHMYEIPLQRFRENLIRFGEVLETGPLLDRQVRTLSLGQRMRCEILASLLHEPKVLFLDEPTIGLDIVAKDRIRAFIQQINHDDGVTVLLTTHDLADIELLCPRVIIIDHGRVIHDGSLIEMRKDLATDRLVCASMGDPTTAAAVAAAFGGEAGMNVVVEGRSVRLTFDQRRIGTLDVVRKLLSQAEPSDLVISEESVEALVKRIYQQPEPS